MRESPCAPTTPSPSAGHQCAFLCFNLNFLLGLFPFPPAKNATSHPTHHTRTPYRDSKGCDALTVFCLTCAPWGPALPTQCYPHPRLITLGAWGAWSVHPPWYYPHPQEAPSCSTLPSPGPAPQSCSSAAQLGLLVLGTLPEAGMGLERTKGSSRLEVVGRWHHATPRGSALTAAPQVSAPRALKRSCPS